LGSSDDGVEGTYESGDSEEFEGAVDGRLGEVGWEAQLLDDVATLKGLDEGSGEGGLLGEIGPAEMVLRDIFAGEDPSPAQLLFIARDVCEKKRCGGWRPDARGEKT
jgi:hypothetical protein